MRIPDRAVGLLALLVLVLGAAVAEVAVNARATDRASSETLGAAREERAQRSDADGSGEPAARSAHGRAVSELATSLDGGCEKGQAISALASSKAAAHRQNPPKKQDPCVKGDEGGGAGASAQGGGPPAGKGWNRPDHPGRGGN